jgi:type I restriction enzyme S subunit
VSSAFLYLALRASQPLLLHAVGTAAHGTKKLDTADLLALKVRVPEPSLMAQLEQNYQSIRAILSAVAARRRAVEGLFDALLSQAFSGVLTARWREAHMTELLREMENKAPAVAATGRRAAAGE